MPLHWQPVGPEPAATYWRRRVVVALAAVAVLWVAALPLLGDDGAQDALSTQPRPSASPAADPTPTPSATPAGPVACPDDALEVTATAGTDSYDVGGSVPLELTITNTGAVPCLRAVGQGAVELIVTSGDDRIWSSDDCAPGGEQGETLLEPGATQTARATWQTVRSAPECPADQPRAEAGTYQVTARVGELRVPGASFTLAG